MAVASTVLDVVSEPGFLEDVRAKALHMKQGLEGLKDQHADVVEDIRGVGLLMGLKLRSHITPTQVTKAAADERLLVVGAGDNTLRVLPPLNASDKRNHPGRAGLVTRLPRVALEMP